LGEFYSLIIFEGHWDFYPSTETPTEISTWILTLTGWCIYSKRGAENTITSLPTEHVTVVDLQWTRKIHETMIDWILRPCAGSILEGTFTLSRISDVIPGKLIPYVSPFQWVPRRPLCTPLEYLEAAMFPKGAKLLERKFHSPEW